MRDPCRLLAPAMFLAALVASPDAAARGLERAAAEGDASYVCRVRLTPASRACLAGCEAGFALPSEEDERWACVQGCTAGHLRAVRACREDATATALSRPPGRAGDEAAPSIALGPDRPGR